MVSMHVSPSIIEASVKANIRPRHHDRAAIIISSSHIARTSRQARQHRDCQCNFDPDRTIECFIHTDLPFAEDPNEYGCPLNMTNFSLIANRNILAAKPEPHT